MDLHTLLVEQVDPEWDHLLARRLLGTDDPEEMAVAVEVLVGALLHDRVCRGLHYHESVGIVIGLELERHGRVAVKLHRPERTGCLEERCGIQRALREAGLPCPELLVEPTDGGSAVATVERWLDGGTPDRPRAPSTRTALAAGLHRFVEAATPFAGPSLSVAMAPAPGSLYPEPHDLRFDFEATAPGAEWIDEVAASTRRVLDDTEPDVVGHVDWRCGNVVVAGEELTAIYDWDSVALGVEPALVGGASTTWSLAWEWGHVRPPDPYDMVAFVADYEQAAGRRFTRAERQQVTAGQLLTLAYLARCEHSDRVLGIATGADRRFADLLLDVVEERLI